MSCPNARLNASVNATSTIIRLLCSKEVPNKARALSDRKGSQRPDSHLPLSPSPEGGGGTQAAPACSPSPPLFTSLNRRALGVYYLPHAFRATTARVPRDARLAPRLRRVGEERVGVRGASSILSDAGRSDLFIRNE